MLLLYFAFVAFIDVGRADSVYSEGFIATAIEGKSVQVGYSRFPAILDPNKPTIIYIEGGPIPLSDRRHPPQGMPAGYQLVVVDYVGTSRDDRSFPSFTPAQVAKNFTSDRQAEIIRDLAKKEALAKYALFGESHGAQVALRAIDKIQSDPTAVNKPIAAILDSGMGRRIAAQDAKERGPAGKHGQCASLEAAAGGEGGNGRPSPPPPYVEAYFNACKFNRLAPENKNDLVGDILGSFPPEVFARGPTAESAKKIVARFGCPPVNKISFSAWRKAMSCDVFEPGVGNNMDCRKGCQSRPYSPAQMAGCLESCASDVPCQSPPLDAKLYRMGQTNILGIQSLDDCQNWVAAMDYLMANLRAKPGASVEPAASAYVRVSRAGGHMVFRDSPQFARCREPVAQARLFAEIFNGDVAKAKDSVLRCYQEAPGANAADSPTGQ
jgi:hypothetical protein